MKIITLAILAMALPLLSACVVEEPYNRSYPHRGYERNGYYAPTRVVIHDDDSDDHDYYDHDDNRRGRFCPPGQAKKGNC